MLPPPVAALLRLLLAGRYPALATHDIRRIEHAKETAKSLQLPQEAFEFQMLYGIRRELQASLVAQGHKMRVYVPYGRDWYAYSTRRLKENPSIARQIVNATLGLGPKSA